jgi:hypothetical protein
MKVPDILYHATLEDKHESIIMNGLSKASDGIYFCDVAQDSAKFLVFKSMFYQQNIIVVEIDTECLNRSLFREGTDHNPNFFGNPNVFVYPDDIPDYAIRDKYWVFDIKDMLNKEE